MKNEANRKKDSHGQDRPRSQGSNRQGSAGADAARALYALNPIEAVTVDDLIGEAVAKKTFYVHFDGLAVLQAAVADQLAHEFDELLQPRRLATEDPVECCGLRGVRRRGVQQSCLGRARGPRRPIHAEHRA